jgi:hypothetical protein
MNGMKDGPTLPVTHVIISCKGGWKREELDLFLAGEMTSEGEKKNVVENCFFRMKKASLYGGSTWEIYA